MKQLVLASLLSALFIAPVYAAESPLYVGLLVGPSSVGNSSALAIGGLVGYKLAPFMNTGTISVEGQITSLGSDKYISLGRTIDAQYTSIGVDAVAMFPLPNVKNVSVFGKLGIASTSSSVNCNGCTGANIIGNTSVSNLVFGFGGQFAVDKHIAIRGGYQTYASNASNIYVAGIYNF